MVTIAASEAATVHTAPAPTTSQPSVRRLCRIRLLSPRRAARTGRVVPRSEKDAAVACVQAVMIELVRAASVQAEH